jgi:hypothetical protein
MTTAPSFDAVWPATAAALEKSLRRRGVPRSDIDDVVQSTAERAMRQGVPTEDPEKFGAWCHAVARNIAADDYRKHARVRVGEVPERRDDRDIGDAVAARQSVKRFREEAALLPPVERAAILSPESGATERSLVVSLAVARLRARRKLRHIIDGLAAGVVGSHVRLRGVRFPHAVAAVAVAAVAVSTVFVTSRDEANARGNSPAERTARGTSNSFAVGHRDSHVSALRVQASSIAGGDSFGAPSSHLVTAPTVELLPTRDGPVIEERPGRDDEQGVALCTGTAVTPYGCYYYPTLPRIPT